MADRSPRGHVPADTLASIALDGPRARPSDGPAAELTVALAHLARCAPCDDTLRQLRRAVAAGRSAVPEDELVAPPARVWWAVLAEVRAETEAAAVCPGPPTPPWVRGVRLLLAAVAPVLLLRGRRSRRPRRTAGSRGARKQTAGGRIRSGARRGRK